jgi:hypothetical protein
VIDAFEQLRARLTRRANAYQALFLGRDKEIAPHAAVVLKDLARYCYVSKPTLKVFAGRCDPLAMAFAEGRRDVFNRIRQLTNLTDDQINKLSGGNDE